MTVNNHANPSTFSVAIIGGGIGGLTVAMSLRTQNPSLKHITVYEKAAQYREIGAGVGLGVNAGRVLKSYGVYGAANAISGDRNGIHRSLRRWDNGEEIVTVKAMDDEGAESGQAPEGVRQLSVHRAEFLKVLYDYVLSLGGVKLITNKRAVEIADRERGGVEVRFADGTSITPDLVIACDGIKSGIRKQLAVADTVPRYSGRICYRGLVPLSAVADDWPHSSYAISWLGPDKHFITFPVSANKTLNVVAFVTKAESELGDLRESWAATAPKEEVQAEFTDWDPTVRRVLEALDSDPTKWKLNDRDLLDQWVFKGGRVVLSGDAAHATLPHQGSGAGHAIEDSFILGRALKAFFENPGAGLEAYMNLYQAIRRPRAHKAQLTSRQAGELYEMQGHEFAGLNTFEEKINVIRARFTDRMTWVWGHDLGREFEEKRTSLGL